MREGIKSIEERIEIMQKQLIESGAEETISQMAEIRSEVEKNTKETQHTKEKTYQILDKIGFLTMKMDELQTSVGQQD